MRAITPDDLSERLTEPSEAPFPGSGDKIVLESHGPSDARPAVRIFVGSEPAQQRAERVFVWSIEQVRDPSRRYEITLMRDLPGFDDARWTTGFTNYRYAVPHLAGGRGRAIYNDVDQIYLADPAELFDLSLAGVGYRAIAQDDTSVMVMNCQEMAPIWSLEAAQTEHKSTLIRWAEDAYGPLDRAFNARDGELAPGSEKCLHFTTLHTQPWRPFPDRYAYQPNPREHLWYELERSADEAGFQLYSRARPSDAYRLWRETADPPSALPTEDAESESYFPPEPGAPATMPARIRLAGRALGDLPASDLPWVLDDLFQSATERVRIEVPWSGRRRDADMWRSRLDAAAKCAPKRRYALTLRAKARTEILEGGAWIAESPPRCWVVTDDRPGNTTQSLGLAESLGFAFERKHLVLGNGATLHNRWLGASRFGVDVASSSPLEAPWPDLVIAAGRRTAPVAEWVREQSGGRTRIVMLGRKGGDDADRFDLCVTPAYTRLPAHPRRLEIAAPLHRIRPETLAEAREVFRDRFSALPQPRIALLVGGQSGQYAFSDSDARALGTKASQLTDDASGSLLVTTSRRVSARAAAALRDATPHASVFHPWRPDDANNPYLGMLAWADAIIVSADSESMLAEACETKAPIYIAELRERASFKVLSLFREWVWRRSRCAPHGRRGTPRPQRSLERIAGRAIERGFVRPTRDLSQLHAALEANGSVRHLASGYDPAFQPTRFDDRARVTRAVLRLMGLPA